MSCWTKKHQSWSRDAESDHRCVVAKFEIAAKEAKGKPRQPKAPKEECQNETNEDGKQQEYLDIEQEVKETELKKKKQKEQQVRLQIRVRKQQKKSNN